MKREIKFRAWDKRFNSWISDKIGMFVDGDGLIYYDRKAGEEDDCVFHPLRNYGYKEDDIELMQFTGAYDKDGDEIYEGDILEFDPREWGDNTTNKHVVSWDEYEHGWSFGGGGQQDDMEWRKVIGNIYENPELL